MGKYLRRFREKYKIEKSEMANKIGISYSYYYRIEHNQTKPSFTTLKKIVSVIESDPFSLNKVKLFYLSEYDKKMEKVRNIFEQ